MQGVGAEGGDTYGETSRRILPVAVEVYRILGEELAMARGTGRFGKGTVGCLSGVRIEVRSVSLAVGSKPSRLWTPLLRGILPQPVDGAIDQLWRRV